MIPENIINDFYIKYINGICYLFQNEFAWMCLTNKEIASHQKYIDSCFGNVLIGGLGLGYAAQNIAAKLEVTSVTIIEKYQEVIDLVWPYIDTDNKANVICIDLFSYVLDMTENYDCAYFDIWSDDGMYKTFYIDPLRRMLKDKIPQENILCWKD